MSNIIQNEPLIVIMVLINFAMQKQAMSYKESFKGDLVFLIKSWKQNITTNNNYRVNHTNKFAQYE